MFVKTVALPSQCCCSSPAAHSQLFPQFCPALHLRKSINFLKEAPAGAHEKSTALPQRGISVNSDEIEKKILQIFICQLVR